MLWQVGWLNIKLNRTQIFADPPAMRGTSGQVYTDNIIILNPRILIICVHLPGCATYWNHFGGFVQRSLLNTIISSRLY